MKKVFLTLCICLAAVVSATAQEKGDMAVGLNLGFAPCLESGVSVTNFGLGAKFQYNVTNPIRLEADLDYWFKAKGMDVFDLSANAHYLFNITDKIKVYPLIGIGYARVNLGYSVDFDFDYDYDFDYYSRSSKGSISDSAAANRFLLNIGAGAEYSITNNLSAGIELKYQYIKDFNRMPITVGVTYKF